MYPQQAINTERLLIRPYQQGDLAAVYKIHQIEIVNEYLPYTSWRSIHDARDWQDTLLQRRRENKAEQYVILLGDTLIGTCLAFHFDELDKSCEFGYVLAPDVWGQGFMIEAMRAFVPNLFDHFGLAKLSATVETENTASIKLLERLHFKQLSSEQEGDVTLLHYTRFSA